MERYFKTEDGKFVNIVQHTLEQLEKYPNLKIYIGTDSQVYIPKIKYVTAIVYRYGEKGAHYVYTVDEIKYMDDDFLRLYLEGSKTLETAEMLREVLPIEIEALEFDYADVKKTLSSKLVSVFKGYMNARFKSCDMIATRAADHICRKHRI